MWTGKRSSRFWPKNSLPFPGRLKNSITDRFVAPLIASYDVVARGFEIRNVSSSAQNRSDHFRITASTEKERRALCRTDPDEVDTIEEDDQ